MTVLIGCESSGGTPAPKAWETQEPAHPRDMLAQDMSPASSDGAQEMAQAQSDIGQPPLPEKIAWPELGTEFVLHTMEESVPVDDPELPVPFGRLFSRNVDFQFSVVLDMSGQNNLHPSYERVSKLVRTEPTYFVGTDMTGADGKHHLYQCDSSTAGRVYVHPDEAVVLCERAGTLLWRLYEKRNADFIYSNCHKKEIKAPPLPRPWLERYTLMVAQPKTDSAEFGVPVRQVAYFPSSDLRVSTTPTKFALSSKRSCTSYLMTPLSKYHYKILGD